MKDRQIAKLEQLFNYLQTAKTMNDERNHLEIRPVGNFGWEVKIVGPDYTKLFEGVSIVHALCQVSEWLGPWD